MRITELEEHLYFLQGLENGVSYGKTTFSVGQVHQCLPDLVAEHTQHWEENFI